MSTAIKSMLLVLSLLALVLTACTSCGEATRSDGVTPGATGPAAETAARPTKTIEVETMPASEESPESATTAAAPATPSIETASLGAGCFWCIEAVLEQIEGVTDVRSGYMGGQVENPTYPQICTGTTGHAEIVEVDFDPSKITFSEVLDWFWQLHDPTTLNRQGADVGTQYRSAIFYHSAAQRGAAERSRDAAQNDFVDPIVTEITEASRFYEAEDYHQDYYRLNGTQPYCRAVIAPKLRKLKLKE